MTRSTAARRRALTPPPGPSGAEIAGSCLGVIVLFAVWAFFILGMVAAAVYVVRWAWGA